MAVVEGVGDIQPWRCRFLPNLVEPGERLVKAPSGRDSRKDANACSSDLDDHGPRELFVVNNY